MVIAGIRSLIFTICAVASVTTTSTSPETLKNVVLSWLPVPPMPRNAQNNKKLAIDS